MCEWIVDVELFFYRYFIYDSNIFGPNTYLVFGD